MSNYTLYHADCLEKMKEFPESSIDAVITDLPYFRVVKENWDNSWATEQDYFQWAKSIFCEYDRLLKPNSSLLIFTR